MEITSAQQANYEGRSRELRGLAAWLRHEGGPANAELCEQAASEIEAAREASKSALCALCAVRQILRSTGGNLNMVKDIDFAIDALRGAFQAAHKAQS